MITVYVKIDSGVFTSRKIKIVVEIFIIAFLVTVMLNFSIPKKNQLISTIAEIRNKLCKFDTEAER